MGSHSENRKRSRIEFDLNEQPIEEIAFEQEHVDLLIDGPAMKRLIKEISQDFDPDLNFTDDAYEALQVAAEDYIIKLFENSNRVAIDQGLTHIAPNHMQSVRRTDSGDPTK